MNELIIENDTEFYGFLSGVDIITAAKVTELLRAPASCAIHENDRGRDVTEEIVRRNGTFYTGTEARLIVPWTMTSTDVCVASCGYLDGEPRPANPAFAEKDWIPLNIGQYMYGKYLQTKIEKGELNVADLI